MNVKIKEFLKRESFYVVLFFCVCILATVIGVTVINNKKSIEVKETVKNVENTTEKSAETKEIDNAKEVKQNTDMAIATSVTPVKLEFVRPVEGNVVVNYTGTNGLVKTKDGSISMLGIYIATGENTKVLAAEKGKVERVDVDANHGLIIVVSHENGFRTTYGNLSKALVKVGQGVSKSENIGLTGKSSNLIYQVDELSKNPYSLYFEIENQNANKKYIDVNPKEYIKSFEVISKK